MMSTERCTHLSSQWVDDMCWVTARWRNPTHEWHSRVNTESIWSTAIDQWISLPNESNSVGSVLRSMNKPERKRFRRKFYILDFWFEYEYCTLVHQHRTTQMHKFDISIISCWPQRVEGQQKLVEASEQGAFVAMRLEEAWKTCFPCISNQIKSNQIKSNQIKSNQIKSNQVKSHQITSNHIKSHHITSNQIKSNQITSNQSSTTHSELMHKLPATWLKLIWWHSKSIVNAIFHLLRWLYDCDTIPPPSPPPQQQQYDQLI